MFESARNTKTVVSPSRSGSAPSLEYVSSTDRFRIRIPRPKLVRIRSKRTMRHCCNTTRPALLGSSRRLGINPISFAQLVSPNARSSWTPKTALLRAIERGAIFPCKMIGPASSERTLHAWQNTRPAGCPRNSGGRRALLNESGRPLFHPETEARTGLREIS